MSDLHREFVLTGAAPVAALLEFVRSNWRALADADKPLSVVVEQHSPRRHLRQNRLYWAILRRIAEDAWVNGRQYPSDVWHAFFAGQYIGWNELPDGMRAPISTTTLDVAAFSEYVTRVQAYAAERLGLEEI